MFSWLFKRPEPRYSEKYRTMVQDPAPIWAFAPLVLVIVLLAVWLLL